MRQVRAGALVLMGTLVACGLTLASVAQATLPPAEFLSSEKSITKIAFTATAGFGSARANEVVLSWTGAAAKGTLEAPNKISKLVLTFTGDKIGSCSVNSPGAKKGEVVTRELKGHLGYINEAIPTVGVLFEPATGTTFGEIEKSACTSALTLSGSVIGKIGPLNKETTFGEILFGSSAKKQEVTKFEGELTEHHLSIGEIPGVFECNESLTIAEKVEIKT